MWLTKNFAKLFEKNNTKTQTSTGEVLSSSSEKASIISDFEHTNTKLVAPKGICYKPNIGEKCLIISSDNQDYYCLGSVAEDKNLSDGDLMLYSGTTAKITIKSNGDINIVGNVTVNGRPI